MRRVATTKTLCLCILVMWIVSLYTCILIITYTLSNPLTNNQQESSDDFFKEMHFTLGKLLNHSNQGAKRLSRQDSERNVEPVQEIETNPIYEMSPLYKCDKYEEKSRTCVHVRQMGTTLNLGVQVEQSDQQVHYRIRWFRYYKQREKKEELKLEFTKKNSPWNINIGGGSTELRISPLTEIDFSYNYFEARIDDIQSQDTEHMLHRKTKRGKKSANQMPIKFVIETINIDMGSLYPGEELTIYARAFIELSLRSITLEWSMKDSDFTDLPSNMRVIGDGSSVVVSELRAKEDRVLICSVYSNKGIFVAKRNFLFKKIDRVHKQDLVHFAPEVNFKRRKKRDTEENPGFEQYDYEIMDVRPQAVSIQEKLKRLKNPSEEYVKHKKRFIDQPDPDYSNKEQDQEESFDQSSDNMAINNKFFYRDGNELQPYLDRNANTRQSTRKEKFLQRSAIHGPQIPKNSNNHVSRFHENPRNGLKAHHESRDAIQEENFDDKFPNNLHKSRDAIQEENFDDKFPNNLHKSRDAIQEENFDDKFPNNLHKTRDAIQENFNDEYLNNHHKTKDAMQSENSYDEFLNNHHKTRDTHLNIRGAIQEENSDDEFPNKNGDDAGFLDRKIKYDNRRAAEVDYSGRRNRYLSLKEIKRSNQLVGATEDDNLSREENVNEMDSNKYTFDEKESILIAECTEDQECNNHAVCLKNAEGKSFCKCISHYRGNGIFCWLI